MDCQRKHSLCISVKLQQMEVENRTRVLQLIGIASSWGGRHPHCALGPDHLKSMHLDKKLTQRGIPARWHAMLRPRTNDMPGHVQLFYQTRDLVQRLVAEGQPFVALGGDHSSSIGIWAGANRALLARGGLGLLWLDAHLDSHTPETSPSGRLHGMPLAVLVGKGNKAWTAIASPPLLASRVCAIGCRSYEPEEVRHLNLLGVSYYSMKAIQRLGLDKALKKAFRRVANPNGIFGISVDLDFFPPEEVPGVSTPVAGGFGLAHTCGALQQQLMGRIPVGVEISEFNPTFDIDGKTVWAIENIIASIFTPHKDFKSRL